MSSPPSQGRLIGHVAETLLIGAIGGTAFGLAGIPAGFLSGSIVCVAAAALLGRPVQVPVPLQYIAFVAIGISLGAVVTPTTLRGMAAWPISMLVLAIAMLSLTAVTALYLWFVHRWDPLSALFAASPGALSQVMVMSAELGADLRGVAIVQTIRVVILAVGLPGGLALFGLAGAPVIIGGATFGQSPAGLAILLAVSLAAAVLLHLLRFPGGLIFGAMLASAILHGGDFINAAIPWWITIAATITLGAITGSRFANTSLRLVLGYIGAGFGSFLVAITVASFFVFILLSFLPLRTADTVIAFAPGALDAMMILALALHLDPVFVGAHHLARFVVISLAMPIAAMLIARPTAPRPDEERKPRKRVPPQD